jgi:hypothetical protein
VTATAWTRAEEARIGALRETTRKRDLTDAERVELRDLRRRETSEAFHRRVAFLRSQRSTTN